MLMTTQSSGAEPEPVGPERSWSAAARGAFTRE